MFHWLYSTNTAGGLHVWDCRVIALDVSCCWLLLDVDTKSTFRIGLLDVGTQAVYKIEAVTLYKIRVICSHHSMFFHSTMYLPSHQSSSIKETIRPKVRENRLANQNPSFFAALVTFNRPYPSSTARASARIGLMSQTTAWIGVDRRVSALAGLTVPKSNCAMRIGTFAVESL